ncbi:hypothetical protein C8J57DRAFT_1728783 [Mycena rebaudengoi]|nr:hypothetical protein C8J57DRAFT_1728783 [Mycena rebaudengoi]
MLMQLQLMAVLACWTLTSAMNISTPKSDLGRIFAVYPGWDMEVNDDNTILGITEQACQMACSADSFCFAYVYFPYGGPTCKLHNSIELANVLFTPGVVTSVGLIGACGTSVDPPLRFFFPKTDSPGPFFT